MFAATAHAEGPRIALQIEREKNRESGVVSRGAGVEAGWQFASGSLIDRIELLIDRSIDRRADAGGEREHESSVFLRIRHSGKATESLTYYLLGGVGHNSGSEQSFNYAYVEPGLKYELGKRWEWTLGFREIDAIDGTAGEHVHKLITGPSYSIDSHHEVELRYARTTGDKRLRAWSVQYTYKF